MRLRIRALLLTVVMLCSMTSTASACIYIPILDPFCWLFGCCGNYGGGGYGYGGYGNPGYAQGGYGIAPANPYTVNRCIDDWLGWGYLRNQEGTLGHYPGRPFGCYQPSNPGVMSPPAPIAGFTTPMVAPYCPMIPPPLRLPILPLFNPCWNPCGPQYMPAPVVQYQPRPVVQYQPQPLYRWSPPPVAGNWGMPCAPQPQYLSQAPAWQMPMGDPCCGDGMEMNYDGGMMQGMPYQEMSSDSGCCGSETFFPQSEQQSTTPPVPQSTMMMSPGSMMMSQNRVYTTNSGFRQMRPQYGRTTWQGSMSAPVTYRQSMPLPSGYTPTMYRRSQPSGYSYNSQFTPAPQPTAWRTMPTNSMPATAQMPRQYQGNPMNVQTMPPQIMYSNPVMMGDNSGDHEFASANPAAFQVTPNSFNGRQPIRQAVYTRPAGHVPTRTVSTRQYPNSVQ